MTTIDPIPSDAVYLLTIEQKDTIQGQPYNADQLFNPVADADGNYIISQQEVQGTTNPTYLWVKDLPWIIWNPPPPPPFPPVK